jgi:hypothetical protein
MTAIKMPSILNLNGKMASCAMTAINLKLRQLMACHNGRGYGRPTAIQNGLAVAAVKRLL